MTDRELLDALARDVADWMELVDVDGWVPGQKRREIVDAIRARHARPVEPPAPLDPHAVYGPARIQQTPTPPADTDDVGTRLLRLLAGQGCEEWARELIRQRDEARREAAHYTDMAMQADVSCQREKARADAAEARERELRALCGDVDRALGSPQTWVQQLESYNRASVLQRRLRPAAAGEGVDRG